MLILWINYYGWVIVGKWIRSCLTLYTLCTIYKSPCHWIASRSFCDIILVMKCLILCWNILTTVSAAHTFCSHCALFGPPALDNSLCSCSWCGEAHYLSVRVGGSIWENILKLFTARIWRHRFCCRPLWSSNIFAIRLNTFIKIYIHRSMNKIFWLAPIAPRNKSLAFP